MEGNDFADVQVFTGAELAERPQMFPSQTVTSHSAAGSVEQSRAIAEAQAAMIVARMNPRDEFSAYNKIIEACKRPSLAEQAEYAYRRGGQLVTGPSIRMAEVLARHWGNMTFGFRELSRAKGQSEIEAFAWDLETNTRVTRSFVVRHIREKKSGNVELTGERDIYELAGNMAQRRVRACILEIIPGDIVDAARDQCRKTLEGGGNGKPLKDRVRDMVAAFSEIGVSQEMIEDFLRHKLTAIVEAEMVRLKQVFRSIRDGVAPREEFFNLGAKPEPDEPEPAKNDKPKVKANAENQESTLDISPEPAQEPEKPKANGKAEKEKAAFAYAMEKWNEACEIMSPDEKTVRKLMTAEKIPDTFKLEDLSAKELNNLTAALNRLADE